MLLNFIVPAYTLLLTVSSLSLQLPRSTVLLLCSASLFIICEYFKDKLPFRELWQIFLLALFHWFSQLNWCMPMYCFLAGRYYYCNPQHKLAHIRFYFYVAVYSSVRLSFSEWNLRSLLILVVDFFISAVLAHICGHFFTTERQKQQLNHEKDHLSTHDGLTGLMNFEAYHNRLEELLLKEDMLVLVHIDCTDLKSMNNAQGFQGGNRVLKQIADLLKIVFSDEALMIARYGGDEFALVLKTEDPAQTAVRLSDVLNSELPRLIGIQLTYGYAVYPDDARAKDDLILVAEKNLFSMKREIWLKREEHMFRAEKLKVVGELASGMAHEIRNPLTTIKGFLQISSANGYIVEPWYDLIMDEITRMSELTAEFLQFSKPHATQFKVQSLNDCIQRVISLMESESTRLGHKIQFQHEPSPVYVLMDQDKMVQLLLNLVKNAFEAMNDEGEVTIRLYHADNHAVVEVQDTGKGIPESELDKVFHPFYTTKEHGTGLGLSICHKIVQDHGGTIELESTSSAGTNFRITLPLASQQHNVLPK